MVEDRPMVYAYMKTSVVRTDNPKKVFRKSIFRWLGQFYKWNLHFWEPFWWAWDIATATDQRNERFSAYLHWISWKYIHWEMTTWSSRWAGEDGIVYVKNVCEKIFFSVWLLNFVTSKEGKTDKYALLLWWQEIISLCLNFNSFQMQISQTSFIRGICETGFKSFCCGCCIIFAAGIKDFLRYCRLVGMAKLWIVLRLLLGRLVQWYLVYSTRFLQHSSSNSSPNGIQA